MKVRQQRPQKLEPGAAGAAATVLSQNYVLRINIIGIYVLSFGLGVCWL